MIDQVRGLNDLTHVLAHGHGGQSLDGQAWSFGLRSRLKRGPICRADLMLVELSTGRLTGGVFDGDSAAGKAVQD